MVITRATARSNLPQTEYGDCFVVSLLAMTGWAICEFYLRDGTLGAGY